ncbi:MAG: hypothetical protein LKJ76_02680 [Lachnospiraceae bacterium]|jgi:hypothetical protein|nr:hypothetical protein [Lachnospiraceae bacterium]
MESVKKRKLANVTLAAMSSVNMYETVKALEYSMRGIDFGEVVLITDRKPLFLPKEIHFRKTSKLTGIDEFNRKMVYELKDYIRTDYVLLVHADGFVIHPENWSDDFLKYDYIGAPWPLPQNDYAYRDAAGRICRVGNSVSIRSRRLLEYPSAHGLPWVPVFDGFYNEDIFLCCACRDRLEADGLSIAPLETAVRFGREHPIPENRGVEPFTFHKWRGENAGYPRFVSPGKRLRAALRPLLFWRKTAGWKAKHGL